MPPAFRNLKLERPLAVLDLEAAGLDVRDDRIVEVAVLVFAPEGPPARFRRLLDPGVPIPAAATAVHGFRDDDVAGKRTFADVAPRLAALLDDADLAGFNVRRIDLPLLAAEFRGVGVDFPLAGRAVIDAQQIFHRFEPRDLTAARRYTGRDHGRAHSAMADAEATAAVLDAQVGAHPELPGTVAGPGDLPGGPDVGGRFRRESGRVVYNFGKYAGRPLREVARRDPAYLRWFLGADFFDDAKGLVRDALGLPAEARSRAPPRDAARMARRGAGPVFVSRSPRHEGAEMNENDGETARRLDELARIACRALAAIDPAGRLPGDDLPYSRAALQLVAALESAAAARGVELPEVAREARAVHEPAFARQTGRGFDARLDAIGREEADALPCHPIDWD